MNILILDTETTSLTKPFCYNIGYCIYNTKSDKIIYKKDFVIGQIWHNLELFQSAYYAEKRQIYINAMRAKKMLLVKWGYATRQIYYKIIAFNVQAVYAYNSDFDDKVIQYNCEWFKNINPLDNMPIYDIKNYAYKAIAQSKEYQEFCDKHSLYTESGNYSVTAENVYKFITKNIDFIESHTALADCEIELDILKYCIKSGLQYNKKYEVPRFIEKRILRELVITDMKKEKHIFKFYSKFSRGNKIFLR